MSDMEALDGPLKGKIYFGLPEHTKTIIDYYRTPYDFYCVTYERTDKGWKFIREVAQSLRDMSMDYSNCEHDDVWFSRDICYCGGMHYYCEDCGVMVDDHFESDESKSNKDEVSDTLCLCIRK
jgi:DNA-binding MarR family transcriptional regulator